jgi:hypothetical protein
MVFKAYKPYDIEWKKVKNERGRTVDTVTGELVKSYDYRPWCSTYGKDYSSAIGMGQESGKFSLPQLKPDLQKEDNKSTQRSTNGKRASADAKHLKPTSEEVRAAFKAAPEPVYLQGDEEFLKQNLVADHFPNNRNPYEVELND